MNAAARDTLLSHLVVDEGVILHAYQDHLGYWTIGAGRLIDQRRGGGISYSEAMYLLGNDVDRTERQVVDRFPWVAHLDSVRQVALFNLAFNLGVEGLAKFVNTLAAVQRADWPAVGNGLRASRWYRQVQKSRSERIISMLVNGSIPEEPQ